MVRVEFIIQFPIFSQNIVIVFRLKVKVLELIKIKDIQIKILAYKLKQRYSNYNIGIQW